MTPTRSSRCRPCRRPRRRSAATVPGHRGAQLRGGERLLAPSATLSSALSTAAVAEATEVAAPEPPPRARAGAAARPACAARRAPSLRSMRSELFESGDGLRLRRRRLRLRLRGSALEQASRSVRVVVLVCGGVTGAGASSSRRPSARASRRRRPRPPTIATRVDRRLLAGASAHRLPAPWRARSPWSRRRTAPLVSASLRRLQRRLAPRARSTSAAARIDLREQLARADVLARP